MTFYVENEVEYQFPFNMEEVAEMVAKDILKTENCPFETEINLLLTDNEGIRGFNQEFRDIDRETDVLSFPNCEYDTPGDFSLIQPDDVDCFSPETHELILGDIIISKDRVIEQAKEYGHSQKREFAFLVAHSMLHLCGYDHMEPEEAAVMEEKQRACLERLGITRDITDEA